MEIDPVESAKGDSDESATPADPAVARLTTWVAITVALLATCLGICKAKEENMVQAMQQAQADNPDQWSFYQARSVREEVAPAAQTQLTLAAASAPDAQQEAYNAAIHKYAALVSNQNQKKQQLQNQAQQDQQTYDALNYR